MSLGPTGWPIPEREAAVMMQTYRRFPVTFVRGEGTALYDDDGRAYLDFAAGIAVAQIGHAHPRWVEAVARQAGLLAHVSNLFYTEPQVALAERLVQVAGWGRVFFANSGAEANEAALKLARRATGRPKFVAAIGGFHGRTLATLAATGQPEKHAPFQPLPGDFVHVPYGDADALIRAIDERTAAVLLEPVLGEGGVFPAPAGYLQTARAACEAAGALLILDEVQTGVGRCGAWFAHLLHDVRPHVMTLAKGLAGGLPIGACIAEPEVAFAAGEHASTFGGGPVPCAAAIAVLEVIESDGLVENARAQGERLLKALSAIASPAIVDVRGAGLLLGVQLSREVAAREVIGVALSAGLVLTEAGGNVVRFTPPLTVSSDEVERAAELFAAALGEAAR